ncbi:MAG: OsmC family protein [Anaerolineales bacterium]|nr:OsmC family protein [Anaerolineales bacterium]
MDIEAVSVQNYQVEITTRGHEWISDEPVKIGGDDRGPSPYELLLGALGACKIITAQMYANRKEWPLEGITLKMSLRKIDARDCDDCASEPGALVDLIEGDIHFKGDLSTDQIMRLHEISNRCPVQRSLTSETIIRVDVQPDPIGVRS